MASTPEKLTPEQFRKVLQETHPYLLMMESYIQKADNGVVSFDVRVFNGSVQDLVVKRVNRHKL